MILGWWSSGSSCFFFLLDASPLFPERFWLPTPPIIYWKITFKGQGGVTGDLWLFIPRDGISCGINYLSLYNIYIYIVHMYIACLYIFMYQEIKDICIDLVTQHMGTPRTKYFMVNKRTLLQLVAYDKIGRDSRLMKGKDSGWWMGDSFQSLWTNLNDLVGPHKRMWNGDFHWEFSHMNWHQASEIWRAAPRLICVIDQIEPFATLSSCLCSTFCTATPKFVKDKRWKPSV